MSTPTLVVPDQAPAREPVIASFVEPAEQGKEGAISREVGRMWMEHQGVKRSLKASQAELKALRQRRGEALFHLKVLLAKPGRTGGWSKFLREKGIPRTSGDRLVAAYERSLHPNGNCPTGAIQLLTEEKVRRLADERSSAK